MEKKDDDKNEFSGSIGYWNHVLGELETRLIKEKSKRAEISSKLTHLNKSR